MTKPTNLPIEAAPGVYIIRKLQEQSRVNIGENAKNKILLGEILDVGMDRQHDDGGLMKSWAKTGDVVAFFSYTDGADIFEFKNEQYFCVIFNDLRAIIKDTQNDNKN